MAEAEEEKQDQSWRSLWLSSGALSLALLGDSLIYVVLPVNAEAFGVSLFWVGILLAANRVIRTFTYGFVAHFSQRVGLRNLCIIACITSVLSTVSYGVFQGWRAVTWRSAVVGDVLCRLVARHFGLCGE